MTRTVSATCAGHAGPGWSDGLTRLVTGAAGRRYPRGIHGSIRLGDDRAVAVRRPGFPGRAGPAVRVTSRTFLSRGP
eukprot:751546-Hanusia_phi.AAC.7